MARLSIVLRLALLALLTPTSAHAEARPMAARVAAATPDAAAREFYGWYLGVMVKDREATDDAAGYARRVTAALRQQVKRQMDSPDGVEADYFIKAQDYLDDWPGHVSATRPVVTGATARTMVTLGTDQRHPWRLAVTMRREQGLWKVARVTKF